MPPSDVRLTLPLHEVSVLSEVKVEDIMTKKVITVKPEMKVSNLLDTMVKYHHMGYPVTDEKGNLIGMVTFEDLMGVPKERRDKVTVKEIAKKNLILTYPGESVLDALKKMEQYDIGRLPVVDPENHKFLLGVITRSDVLHALGRFI